MSNPLPPNAIPLSVLDLAPVTAGSTPADALRNTRELAQLADRTGYTRYWLAEHHNMTGIASAATAVVIAHIAGATQRIRVGAGGIMLPNHAPLVIAEQFGTLESLFPGRIDLGLGRAPGTDQNTARALRRHLAGSDDNFPQDVLELQSYFQPAQPNQAVRAVPGAGLDVPIWLLGSSLYSAELAAHLGLPFAFASHFAPRFLFRPSTSTAAASSPPRSSTSPTSPSPPTPSRPTPTPKRSTCCARCACASPRWRAACAASCSRPKLSSKPTGHPPNWHLPTNRWRARRSVRQVRCVRGCRR
jgi:luciferase family oxidoreductase, group 1